ncbi:glucose oxidase [Colletotrichum costaricense]|uniref:Glucose oxidase n=1 Tax=Colletotrichum costaricense TaxID=1209916 RepID=A0AAI9YSC4_9PEZI|nr:glucose oxidase [Colletotrichum costaricense]KAK1520573.1 glucose oxidase [Colletotrichum costaricense]
MTKIPVLVAALGFLLANIPRVISSSIPRSIAHSRILPRACDVKAEYDYVIVGGGTSGLTVADRLTESGEHTVLVIELGLFVNTVTTGLLSWRNQSHTFNFSSVPQEGLNGRKFNVIGGVMLGGSTGVNAMQVHRGQKEDYDRWGSYFSNQSEWSWDGLLPYFKKVTIRSSEVLFAVLSLSQMTVTDEVMWPQAWNFHPPTPELTEQFDIKYDASFWGNSSGIHASFPTFHWPMLKTEVEAFKEIKGVDFPADSGAGDPGVFWYPTSFDPATVTRSMARRGHWDGIQAARDNYETITGHKVLKVLFDGDSEAETRTATGVSYVEANSTIAKGARIVKARKEVILATGSIHTPQILQRSGVGGRALLEAVGIDVVVDLPGVGQNFQDHPVGAGATFTFTNFDVHPDMTDLVNNQTFIDQAKAEFEANRTGPLTIGAGNVATFLPFPVIAPSFEAITSAYESQSPSAHLPPNTDPTVIAGYAAQQTRFAAALRSPGAAFYNFFLRGSPTESNFVLLHPLSRGTISLNTSDPFFSEPIVDYRALSNPADLAVQIEFIRFTRRYFLQSATLARYEPVETVPGTNVTSDEALGEAVRRMISPTTFHPVGTAAMMPRALGGVVDEGLEVYGVRGLSVVDASVMPDLPGAYTQQTVYAVAEKAADLIKARA